VFTVIVRSKRDADAARSMIERFYADWGVEVATLKGARSLDSMVKELEAVVDRRGLYLVLLGREDAEHAASLQALLPPNVAVHVVPKARVRNARLEQLYVETLRARARLRLAASWSSSGVYLLAWGRGESLEDYIADVSFDNFIGVGRFNKQVEALIGRPVGENPLILRLHGGTHYVYNGPRVRAVLRIGDRGTRPSAELRDAEPLNVDLARLVNANRGVVDALASASKAFLEKLGDFDQVIVPWSGGKDSTAALLLALETYGRRRVVAVYGDTGTEFPATHRYVEETARKLGVALETAYAGVDRELERGAPMPTHSSRWCTGLKVAAIERKISELADAGRTLVIIGDRDAESPRRSDRPPVRSGPAGTVAAAPLKLWGGAHVQLYILSRGIGLNPMYGAGFYRIGCYMCPALRNWEIHVMMREAETLRLLGSRIYRRFIHSRVYRRPPEGGEHGAGGGASRGRLSG